MSRANSHFEMELQDLLDDRLPEARRAALTEHVAACAQCRRELEALRSARNAVRTLPNESIPSAMRARLLAGLDAEDNARRETARRGARARRTRWLASAAVLGAAAAALLFLVRRAPAVVDPAQIAADYVAYQEGRLELGVRSAAPATVESYFRGRGIAFATRVFDLGMMGFQVVGGAVNGAPPRERALFVYREADGTTLVCQMYVGLVSNLPAATEVREHDGIVFHVYRQGNLTLVFWQEGDVICVLTSDAKPETVIDLAFAKAVKV